MLVPGAGSGRKVRGTGGRGPDRKGLSSDVRNSDAPAEGGGAAAARRSGGRHRPVMKVRLTRQVEGATEICCIETVTLRVTRLFFSTSNLDAHAICSWIQTPSMVCNVAWSYGISDSNERNTNLDVERTCWIHRIMSGSWKPERQGEARAGSNPLQTT